MDVIKSKDNSRIKLMRPLQSKKNRDKESMYVLEGIKFIREALNSGAEIAYVAVNEDEYLNAPSLKELVGCLLDCNVECYLCSSKVFDGATDVINSQGVAAVIRKKSCSAEELADESKLIILCDRIQDPGNLGTIIRTVDAFGPAGVILDEGCVDCWNPKVVRAAAGASFRVNAADAGRGADVIKMLKEKGWYIACTVVESDYSFDDMKQSDKICIVIGNEGQGVSKSIQELSDICLTIRMTGNAESLNASIAAGISIYEIRKKLL